MYKMKQNVRKSILFVIAPVICSILIILSGCVGGRGNGGGCSRSIVYQPVYEECGSGGTLHASFDQATQDKIDNEYTTREFMANCIIALCKDRGYTDAATKGLLGYCLAEGTGFGSYTYESYWCFAPIDTAKGKNDTTMDNEAWQKWLNDNRGHYEHSANTTSFGLGIFQMSDTKDSTGATEWVQSAITDQYYWQDPYWNVNHSLDIFENYLANDTQNDAFDPRSFNGPTDEGIGRCTCLVGMPGWTYPASGDYWNAHIGQAAEAEQKFNDFPKDFKVPTFGKAPKGGTNKCKNNSSGADNSSIAACAVSLAYDPENESFAGHEVIRVNTGSDGHSVCPTTQVCIDQRKKVCGDEKTADCGYFVATVIRSTVDKDYPAGYTPDQDDYMKTHSDKYEQVASNAELTSIQDKLQPGDIFVHGSHTFLYVGNEAIVAVFNYITDTSKVVVGASQDTHGPSIQGGSGQGSGYNVYRFKGTPDPHPEASTN